MHSEVIATAAGDNGRLAVITQSPSAVHFTMAEGYTAATVTDSALEGTPVAVDYAPSREPWSVIGNREGKLLFVDHRTGAVLGKSDGPGAAGGFADVFAVGAKLAVGVTADGSLHAVTAPVGGHMQKVGDSLGVSLKCRARLSGDAVVLGLRSGALALVAVTGAAARPDVSMKWLRDREPVDALGASGTTLWVARGNSITAHTFIRGEFQDAAMGPFVIPADADAGNVRVERIFAAKNAALVSFATEHGDQLLLELVVAAPRTAASSPLAPIIASDATPAPLGKLLCASAAGHSLRRRWTAVLQRGADVVHEPIQVDAPPAAGGKTLPQLILAASADDDKVLKDLGQLRARVDEVVRGIEANVEAFAAGAPKGSYADVARAIVDVQSAVIALSRREVAQAGKAIDPQNSAARLLQRRLHCAFVRLTAAELLYSAGSTALPIAELIATGRQNRRAHMVAFRDRFNKEFKMDNDPSAVSVADMVRWEPRGLCIEALLARCGLQHDVTAKDVVLSMDALASEAHVILILYLALAGRDGVPEERFASFFSAVRTTPSCLQWARAAFAADTVKRDFHASTLDTACLEGLRLVPTILEAFCDAGMIEVAYRIAPLALVQATPRTPLGDKLAIRLAFVMFHVGNGDLLAQLVRLSRATSWRPLMLRIAAHAAVAQRSIALFDVFGATDAADEATALMELGKIDDLTASRLRVQYLVLACRFEDALRECESLPAPSAREGQENQIVASYLRTLVNSTHVSLNRDGAAGSSWGGNGSAGASVEEVAPASSSVELLRDDAALTRVVALHGGRAAGAAASAKAASGSQGAAATSQGTSGAPTRVGSFAPGSAAAVAATTGGSLFTKAPSLTMTPTPITNPKRLASVSNNKAAPQ